MAVPYTFGNATTSIPLSQLDTNFATAITIGNTAVYLGNTTTTFGNVTLNNVTINSGNSTVSSESISGNLTFTGTGNRILGDFSNATHANRVMFQTSTTNGATNVGAIPVGTGTQSQFVAYGGTDPANTSFAQFINTGTEATIRASAAGTGTYLPMTFYTNGSERMRIDTSGNVGIGTTSPSQKVQIAGGSIQLDTATSVAFGNINTRMQGASDGSFIWYGSATERMRIDTSGNVGIGTTNINAKFVVSNAGAAGLEIAPTGFSSAPSIVSYNRSGAAYTQLTLDASVNVFAISGTEKARIDSSGNLLVGTTSSSLTSGVGIKLAPSATAPFIDVVGSSSVNSDINYIMYSTGASAYRFYVGFGGTVYATSTTISGISDQRLKENIADLDVGLDAIMALKPRKFDWKKGKGKDIKGDRGFIAQEFETVFPDLIDEWKDPPPEGEEPYKAVRADLIPVLVKAIQELKAELDALKGTK